MPSMNPPMTSIIIAPRTDCRMREAIVLSPMAAIRTIGHAVKLNCTGKKLSRTAAECGGARVGLFGRGRDIVEAHVERVGSGDNDLRERGAGREREHASDGCR